MRTIPITTTSLTESPTSPWHSPVPYLFGGLAAMLGFMAFALLVLACSYWRLYFRLDDREGISRDLENGGDEKEGDFLGKGPAKVCEEKVLVIMAGDERPSFLATPMCVKIVSLDGEIEKDVKKEDNDGQNNQSSEKRTVKEMNNRDHVSDPEQNHGDTDNLTTMIQNQL